MRRIRAIAALTLALATLTALAAPAQAAVLTYGCRPNAVDWDTAAAWGDGTVAEVRRCLQHDYTTGKVRVRSEMRVRKGGVADSGADWDFDNNSDGRGLIERVKILDGAVVVENNNFADTFNESYVVRYSNWGCWGSSTQTYYGSDLEWRVTPTGLSRSGYKDGATFAVTDNLVACGL